MIINEIPTSPDMSPFDWIIALAALGAVGFLRFLSALVEVIHPG